MVVGVGCAGVNRVVVFKITKNAQARTTMIQRIRRSFFISVREKNKSYLVVPVPHSPLNNARSSHFVPSDNVHIPDCHPFVSVIISNVHHFALQLTEAGLARLVVPVVASVPVILSRDVAVPVAYCRHFGSVGFSQYMSVQASGFPSLTVQ